MKIACYIAGLFGCVLAYIAISEAQTGADPTDVQVQGVGTWVPAAYANMNTTPKGCYLAKNAAGRVGCAVTPPTPVTVVVGPMILKKAAPVLPTPSDTQKFGTYVIPGEDPANVGKIWYVSVDGLERYEGPHWSVLSQNTVVPTEDWTGKYVRIDYVPVHN